MELELRGCDKCAQTFCLEHSRYAAHHCPKVGSVALQNQVILCPLCDGAVKLTDEGADAVWERHYNTVCPREKKKKAGKCPVQGCKEKLHLSNRYECERCKMVVCLRHRSREDHDCIPEQKVVPMMPNTANDEALARQLQAQERGDGP